MVTDQDIISTYINTKSKANGLRLYPQWLHIKLGDLSNMPIEHIEYLRSRYNEYYSSSNEQIYEALYRLGKGIEHLAHCIICGKPVNYKFGHIHKTCSIACGYKAMGNTNKGRLLSDEVKERIKQTNIERYGNPYAIASKHCKDKIKQTCLERYGVENPLQNEEILKKRTDTNIKRYGGVSPTCDKTVRQKQLETNMKRYGTYNTGSCTSVITKRNKTNLERYGAENPFASSIIKNKIKQTCLERYGAENYQQSVEGRERIHANFATGIPQLKDYLTKKKNGTFKSSKCEEHLCDILCEIFDKDDIIREYKESRYPFKCDFYIKSLDLFIELQGHYTHGEHPFDSNNPEDIAYLEKYKKHKYIRETWTIRDPHKREVAKLNNLNYIEIFNTKFDKTYIENLIKDVPSYRALHNTI